MATDNSQSTSTFLMGGIIAGPFFAITAFAHAFLREEIEVEKS